MTRSAPDADFEHLLLRVRVGASHSWLTAYPPEPVLVTQVAPMLAQLQSHLPSGEGWRYEPKLDGFRGLLQRQSSTTARLLSRNRRDLGPWFPELLQAGQALPADTLIDGEIVIADERGQIDFGALQARLSVARKHVSRTASEQPAVLVAFVRSKWVVPASSMSR